MKKHYALKRPGMKYPRTANWCLDIGMIFMTCGVVGFGASMIGMMGESGEYAALGGCVIGFIMYSVAIYVSKIDVNNNIETKTVLASSETKWTAECPYCFEQNEVDTDEYLSGSASSHTCSVCHKEFAFRAGT